MLSLRRKKLALVNISDCNVYLESIKCLRVAWSIAAALVIECKFFETRYYNGTVSGKWGGLYLCCSLGLSSGGVHFQ